MVAGLQTGHGDVSLVRSMLAHVREALRNTFAGLTVQPCAHYLRRTELRQRPADGAAATTEPGTGTTQTPNAYVLRPDRVCRAIEAGSPQEFLDLGRIGPEFCGVPCQVRG